MSFATDVSLPSQMVRGRRRGWSPAMLFAAGGGVWFDPADPATLWKDVAGTDPVTQPGDAVARIDDKSGAGNHALQADVNARPTYDLDAAGAPCLVFDGVDDVLTTQSATGLSGDFEATAFVSVTLGTVTGWKAAFSQSPGTTGAGFAMTLRDRRPALDLWANRIRGTAVDTDRHVIGLTKTAGTLTAGTLLEVDGLTDTAALEGTDQVPALVDGPLSIGELDPPRRLACEMHGLVLTYRALGAADRARLTDWLAG